MPSRLRSSSGFCSLLGASEDPEPSTQSPYLLPSACLASSASHHLPQVPCCYCSLLGVPLNVMRLTDTSEALHIFFFLFYSVWDAYHSLVWPVNSFVQFKSQLDPQLAPHYPCQPIAGKLGLQVHFYSAQSLHFSNPPFASGF